MRGALLNEPMKIRGGVFISFEAVTLLILRLRRFKKKRKKDRHLQQEEEEEETRVMASEFLV